MKKLVYSFYSAYLAAYDYPQVASTASDEEELKVIYKRTVLQDPDKAFMARAHEKTLVLLGTFDDETGLIEVNKEPKKLLDLASCFPIGYLARKEAVNG